MKSPGGTLHAYQLNRYNVAACGKERRARVIRHQPAALARALAGAAGWCVVEFLQDELVSLVTRRRHRARRVAEARPRGGGDADQAAAWAGQVVEGHRLGAFERGGIAG